MQPKLLRVIQERVVRPVGATTELPIQVRIVCATHRDLAADVASGRFRQDLFYRLNVIPIQVPALRERREDLPAIAARVLERSARDSGLPRAPALSAPALDRLVRHPFLGNVRELENLLHRAVALCEGDTIGAADLGLAAEVVSAAAVGPPAAPHATGMAADDPLRAGGDGRRDGREAPHARDEGCEALPGDLAAHLDQVERSILLRALEASRYNRTAAGASLGLSLRQMRYRMARLGIVAPGDVADAGSEDGAP